MKIYPKYHYEHMQIELPYDFQHRCIKLLLENGSWLKVWRVRSPDELRQKLIKFHPVAAYISTSTYLDPLHVSLKWKTQRRGEYKVRQNTIMTSDFVPDFDDRYYNEALKKYVPTDAKEDVQKAHDYLKDEAGFRKFKTANTKRGFHLWVLDSYEKRCRGKGPIRSHERELFMLHEKRNLANELLQHGVHFDYKVTVDTRRVVRLWGSLHQDGFTICNAYDNINDAIKNHTSSLVKGEVNAHGLYHNAQGGQKSVTSTKLSFVKETLTKENLKEMANFRPMTSNGYDGGDVVKVSLVEKTHDSALLPMGSPVTPH